jgi:hypothetical protein
LWVETFTARNGAQFRGRDAPVATSGDVARARNDVLAKEQIGAWRAEPVLWLVRSA